MINPPPRFTVVVSLCIVNLKEIIPDVHFLSSNAPKRPLSRGARRGNHRLPRRWRIPNLRWNCRRLRRIKLIEEVSIDGMCGVY